MTRSTWITALGRWAGAGVLMLGGLFGGCGVAEPVASYDNADIASVSAREIHTTWAGSFYVYVDRWNNPEAETKVRQELARRLTSSARNGTFSGYTGSNFRFGWVGAVDAKQIQLREGHSVTTSQGKAAKLLNFTYEANALYRPGNQDWQEPGMEESSWPMVEEAFPNETAYKKVLSDLGDAYCAGDMIKRDSWDELLKSWIPASSYCKRHREQSEQDNRKSWQKMVDFARDRVPVTVVENPFLSFTLRWSEVTPSCQTTAQQSYPNYDELWRDNQLRMAFFMGTEMEAEAFTAVNAPDDKSAPEFVAFLSKLRDYTRSPVQVDNADLSDSLNLSDPESIKSLFEKKITATIPVAVSRNGQRLLGAVQVSVYWGLPERDTFQRLYKEAWEQSDIIFYAGHSRASSQVACTWDTLNPARYLKDFPTRKGIFVIDGCSSAQYHNYFQQHPEWAQAWNLVVNGSDVPWKQAGKDAYQFLECFFQAGPPMSWGQILTHMRGGPDGLDPSRSVLGVEHNRFKPESNTFRLGWPDP